MALRVNAILEGLEICLQGGSLESDDLCICHKFQKNTVLCNKGKSCRCFCRKEYEHTVQDFHILQTAISDHIHF